MDLYYYSRTPELAEEAKGKGVQEREISLGEIKSGGEYLGEITDIDFSNGVRIVKLNTGTEIYEHVFHRFNVTEPRAASCSR